MAGRDPVGAELSVRHTDPCPAGEEAGMIRWMQAEEGRSERRVHALYRGHSASAVGWVYRAVALLLFLAGVLLLAGIA
jgi:hypothetical protein